MCKLEKIQFVHFVRSNGEKMLVLHEKLLFDITSAGWTGLLLVEPSIDTTRMEFMAARIQPKNFHEVIKSYLCR